MPCIVYVSVLNISSFLLSFINKEYGGCRCSDVKFTPATLATTMLTPVTENISPYEKCNAASQDISNLLGSSFLLLSIRSSSQSKTVPPWQDFSDMALQ